MAYNLVVYKPTNYYFSDEIFSTWQKKIKTKNLTNGFFFFKWPKVTIFLGEFRPKIFGCPENIIQCDSKRKLNLFYD
jgi:hypothetical protein